MEQVTVKELATEFEMKSSVVISELKKIGVWVPSPTTPVDTDIANRIRKRLQMLAEADQDDKEKKTDKAKKDLGPRARRSIKELGKPRKRTPAKKEAEEPPPETAASPLAGSLRPRKGRRADYQKVEAREEEVLELSETRIEEEPLIQPTEAAVPSGAPEKPEERPAEEAFPPAEVEAQQEAAEAQPLAEVIEPEPIEPTPAVAAEPEAPRALAVSEPEPAPTAEEPVEEVEFLDLEELEPAVGKGFPEIARLPVEKEVSPKRLKRSVVQKKKEKKAKIAAQVPAAEEAASPSGRVEVVFSEKVTVKSFAEKTGVKGADIIRALIQLGVMATMNQQLSQDIVEKLCEKLQISASFVTFEEEAAIEDQPADRPEDMTLRAPVVTVMGHVDHGKTTLLDHIRNTRVAEGEAGGITQHIGAYQVVSNGHQIVFIDTPGHEAFTRMRARGAQATDIVVLVVAADDGVMPQTLEAIGHAKAAGVPIIVAINKIDKPGAQPDRVKKELSERGLLSEDWGGDTIMVNVSAKEGTNVNQLLEMILLVSEMQELRANSNRSGTGVILEARMEKGRGSVATLLLQNGTLHVGDIFIAGSAYGRIRAMFDDRGQAIQQAGPSSAVEILGLQGIPQAGDPFQVVEDQIKAREMVEFRHSKQREQDLAKTARVSLEDLFSKIDSQEQKELGVVLKADTQGSVEVLQDTLLKLSTGKVAIRMVLSGVGAINESDVILASASNAIIIGFNVRPEPSAKAVAEHENVEIRLYSVIYDVSSDVRQAMLGLLEPTIREKYLGRAEVRDTFRVPKVGTVAGCHVHDGTISRNAEVRLLRDNVVVYQGRIASLKRFKDDVGEVRSGYDCGLSITNFNDIKVGDAIEAFTKEEVAPQLN